MTVQDKLQQLVQNPSPLQVGLLAGGFIALAAGAGRSVFVGGESIPFWLVGAGLLVTALFAPGRAPVPASAPLRALLVPTGVAQ